ncbi:hypothetical protein E2C01_047562 [Portunus trituberculatus]|uniref:Uncharacterized protein n=1 Tax=Portunus trituberculatus TaxID=210409 RepID=A0A5B7GAV1_PORTR|nr:hypothetical protein [Portunus trituberculatus]
MHFSNYPHVLPTVSSSPEEQQAFHCVGKGWNQRHFQSQQCQACVSPHPCLARRGTHGKRGAVRKSGEGKWPQEVAIFLIISFQRPERSDHLWAERQSRAWDEVCGELLTAPPHAPSPSPFTIHQLNNARSMGLYFLASLCHKFPTVCFFRVYACQPKTVSQGVLTVVSADRHNGKRRTES